MKWLMPILLLIAADAAAARVDTLRGTADIDDSPIYGYADCTSERPDEDCRRYNGGGLPGLDVGQSDVNVMRAVMRFPGWDGQLPDSSVLELYCMGEEDDTDRRILVYPLTRRIYEGTESEFGVGDYPNPDSGVTWYHAWLDDGDQDSLTWTAAGGDYSTAVACTVLVTGTGVYHRARSFNRLLSWWRDHAADPGLILVNENAFPANASGKTFASSEHESFGPRLILYYPDEPVEWNGRRLRVQTITRQ